VNPVQRYVDLCAEVLQHTRALAQAARESRWEAVLTHLLAREAAMREVDRMPPPSPSELDALRAQALPLLQEAVRMSDEAARRVRRVRDLLRPVVASTPPRFLDVYR
jgi:hypothetical protein